MKRAKIMLMGIAVCAVVGTGLAFKASKFTGTNVFYSFGTVNSKVGCLVTKVLATTYTPTIAGGVVIPYSIATVLAPTSTVCTARVIPSQSE